MPKIDDQPAHRIDVETPVDAGPLACRVLSRPVFGEARIDHATAATSGGTNSGIMLTAAMKRLHGVSVRTTTQENVSPITTASAVPPPQAISELASARWTFGLPRTVMKLVSEMIEHAEPVHHRIGVGQRAEQQHRDRIDHQKGEHDQQRGRPQPAERHAPGGSARCDQCGSFRGHASSPRDGRTFWRAALVAPCLAQKTAARHITKVQCWRADCRAARSRLRPVKLPLTSGESSPSGRIRPIP